jgi:serine protease Do
VFLHCFPLVFKYFSFCLQKTITFGKYNNSIRVEHKKIFAERYGYKIMEEYRNDNMESAAEENGEVRNVPLNEGTKAPAADFSGQTGEIDPTPVQEAPDTQKPSADSTPWNHWSNAQPIQQEPQNTTRSVEANRPSNAQYTPLGNITGQSGSTLNPAWMQKSESGEYRYRPPYTPVPGGPGERPPKKKKEHSKNRAGIALIVAACLLFSFGMGLGGAYFGIALANGSSTTGNASGKDSLVIYKTAVIADANGNKIEDPLTQAQVYETVKNSVVEITTDFLSSYGNFQYVSSGAGSGVVVSENGYIVTNNHVIVSDNKVADTIKVRLTDGTEYEAQLIGRDEDSDIALLKIDAEELEHAVFGDSSTLQVGDQVMAVGNPLGQLGGTATSGIVSATDREITVDNTVMTLIQIDAAINPGNSGGGLFNMKGELVGVVNAKSTGTEIEGLGFAIPINDAEHVIGELQANGYVTGKTFIGVSLLDIKDSYTAYRYFRSQATGVYVMRVGEGYNDSALQVGDRIISVDGAEITSASDVEEAIEGHAVGDVLTFTIYRGGQMMDVEVTCYEYTPDSDIAFSQDRNQ